MLFLALKLAQYNTVILQFTELIQIVTVAIQKWVSLTSIVSKAIPIK